MTGKLQVTFVAQPHLSGHYQNQVDEIRWQYVSLGEIEGRGGAKKLKAAVTVPFSGTDLLVQSVCEGTEPSFSVEWCQTS